MPQTSNTITDVLRKANDFCAAKAVPNGKTLQEETLSELLSAVSCLSVEEFDRFLAINV